MPREKDFKRRVRRRMERTGERYTEARQRLLAPAGPIGWQLAGMSPDAYEHVIESDPRVPGGRVDLLRCVADPTGDRYGELAHSVPADGLRGGRIRYSALIRGDDVASWACLWMRVVDHEGSPLTFDNMEGRARRGTFAWTAAEIVLDVPAEAARITYGMRLKGRGAVRLADAALTTVDPSVSVTNSSELVAGWSRAGTAPDFYELVAERDESSSAPRQVCRLTSRPGAGVGFGSMTRARGAAPYRGQRLRFSADIQGEAADRAAAWMRIDDASGRILALNNMEDRMLSGTFGWTTVAIVLDVPQEAATIPHGVLLQGTGTIRVADTRLEPVDASVGDTLPAAPVPRWTFIGTRPDACRVAVEEAGPRGRAMLLSSVADPDDGVLALAQRLVADCYRGGRIQFGASMRSDDPSSHVGLWLRADAGADTIAIDNMEGRSLRGVSDWTPMEVALDIPADATGIAFGLWLEGHGSVRVTDLRFQSTGAEPPPPESRPRNLDFAES